MIINEQVQCVASYREKLASLKTARDVAYQQWQKDNELLLKDLAETSAVLEEEEATLRVHALIEYGETQNKNPAPGVSVKIFIRLDYEAKEALAWAINHTVALQLDKKLFENLVKAMPVKPDFVTSREEPQAQIASDLSKILEPALPELHGVFALGGIKKERNHDRT